MAVKEKGTSMRQKLEKIIDAYAELEKKMGDPAVIADQKEFTKLAKEFSNQKPLVEKAREYVQDCEDLEEAREMLDDPEMKEFGQEEIARIEAELPELEDEIKVMLIPADPADEKDIIVEIRGGAGGDEAPSSRATCSRCTSASATSISGRSSSWTRARRRPAATSPSSSR